MSQTSPLRFPIRFDSWYALLSRLVLISPADSYLEVCNDEVRVRMGWAFRACFPCAAVVKVAIIEESPLSRGVHGFAGRWLVNGSGQGILAIDLVPYQRGSVMGFPVQLRQLLVSLVEPSAVAALLRQ